MFLFIPEKSQKYSHKVKTENIIKISKKYFNRYKRRCKVQPQSPFNIKHLNYNGNNERFLKYFKEVNGSIYMVNYKIKDLISYSRSLRMESLKKIDIEQNDIKVDGFNIMMKEKLGCPTSKEFYVKKKEKNKKIKTYGNIEKCLFECILD